MLLFLKRLLYLLDLGLDRFSVRVSTKITAILEPGEDDPANNHLGMPSSMIASRSNKKSMTLPDA